MFKGYLAQGSIEKLDYQGNASWNPLRIKPAAIVSLHLPNNPSTPPCRILDYRAHNKAGIHWPMKIGDKVLVLFMDRADAPMIIGSGYHDGNEPPDGADEKTGILYLNGHRIGFWENGISIETSDGKAILLRGDDLSIAHPQGQSVVMDKDGNIRVTIPGDLDMDLDGDMDLDIEGSVDISSEGEVKISGKLGIELDTENKISLKTLKQIAGIINELTHPVCYITGAPIGGSETVEAGS